MWLKGIRVCCDESSLGTYKCKCLRTVWTWFQSNWHWWIVVQNKTIAETILFIHLFSMESSPNSYLSLNCSWTPLYNLFCLLFIATIFLLYRLTDYECNFTVLGVKVKLFLCTPCWLTGNGGLTSLVLDLGTGWRLVVSFTPRSL
jgi:hypothetical protein